MLLNGEFEPFVYKLCQENDISSLAPKIVQYAAPALRLHTIPKPNYGSFEESSRFGGQPALPKNVDWPKSQDGQYLDFILQLNLQETTTMPLAKKLPEKGMIYLFADHRFQEDFGDYKVSVIHSSATYRELRNEPHSYEHPEMQLKQRLIRFAEVFTIYDAHRFSEMTNVQLTPEEEQSYQDLFDCATCDEAMHLLFGVQTHNDSGGLYVSDGTLIEQTHEWQHLFCIDSDSDVNMMWGDGGRINVYIKSESLARHDFSNLAVSAFSH